MVVDPSISNKRQDSIEAMKNSAEDLSNTTPTHHEQI